MPYLCGTKPKTMTHETKIEKAALEFYIAYCNHQDERYLTTNEKRSISLRAHYAEKRLEKILGFDMGNLPSLTPEQWQTREDVYSKVKELRKSLND